MTPQNLLDYVKLYEDFLPRELCKSAADNLNSINWEQHTFYRPHTDSFISYDHELSISFDDIPEKSEIDGRIWFALEKYILQDFATFGDWFDGWQGYTSARFNRYDPTTQMRLHCDHISSMFDGDRKGIPVLTILGALNDDYEGGEFMMFGGQRIDLPAGSIVVFPSNFMFPHEVKPVTSGVRYSFVSWSW